MIKDRPTREVEDWHDISCEFRRGETLVRRQLGKKLIGTTRAGWALFVFCFQDRVNGAWAPARTSLQRWRKIEGLWRPYPSNTSRVHMRMGRGTEVAEALIEFENSWEAIAAELDRAEADELRRIRRAERAESSPRYSYSSRL